MILVQIATALAIGAFVVLSKDVHSKRRDATPRESPQGSRLCSRWTGKAQVIERRYSAGATRFR